MRLDEESSSWLKINKVGMNNWQFEVNDVLMLLTSNVVKDNSSLLVVVKKTLINDNDFFNALV